MTNLLRRSVKEPIREGLTWEETWKSVDAGLIWCWERGRQLRLENPDLAARAESGELLVLAWKGGVEKKLENETKAGTLQYLATWQGMRGEDLNVDLTSEHVLTCSKTGQTVVFNARQPADDA